MKMTRYVTTSYEEEIPKTLDEFRPWEFSSGSTTGNDFRAFARLFKKGIAERLPTGASLVKSSKGHYIASGFIKRQGKFIYFSVSDVRHFPGDWYSNILIRTAKSDTDYTGGSNCYTSLDEFTQRVDSLLS